MAGFVTGSYKLLWGEHIHHGLWSADESAADAQLRLTREVARLAGIRTGERVLDVGCGMGGSSLHLARTLQCQVTGITISPFQRRWASWAAWRRGLSRFTDFCCADAETIEFEPNRFDVVWSIECTEHLFDKPEFFRRAAGWLRPGGRMAICAWLVGDRADSQQAKQMVLDVCEGSFCPSLGSASDYRGWLEQAGLRVGVTEDWTDSVVKTWSICEARVKRTGVSRLAGWVDRDTVRFLQRFRTIRQAYEQRAMAYGCFVAEKPA